MKQHFLKLWALLPLLLCGVNAWALSADKDGVYQIRTAEDLYEFAKMVNGGSYNASAVLTADIDYSAYGTDGNALIGGSDEATAYAGTFDAQNHKVTVNWNLDRATCGRAEGMGGLFGRMGNGASVKNLWLDGTLKGNGHRMSGLCQNIKGVNIQNVLVTVNIISTWKGEDSDLASGGIFGQATGANRLVNVVFAGSFKCKDNGGNGKNEWFAGICGWVENGLTTLENCVSIIESFEVDEVSAVGSDENGYNIKTSPMSRHDENLVEAYNCYSFIPEGWQYKTNYKNYFTENGDKTCDVALTRDQIASGELCYMLNSKIGENVFTQDIGIDNFVLPFPLHDKVLLADGKYTNYDGTYYINTPEKLKLFASRVNAGEYDLNATITADIDYTAYGTDGNALIGGSDEATAYAGTFDAQNHKITVNWNLDRATCGRAEGMGGLFGRMANGASVKNLWLDGTLMGNGHRMSGLCQNIKGVNIQNVVVTVNIISTWKGEDSDLASGGIFGQATGTNRLNNVIFAGSFKCKDNGGNGKNEWFAGICGWVENGLTTLENCASIIESFEVDEVSAVGSDENGYNIKTSPMSRHDENLVEAYNCYSFIPEDWQYKTNYKNYFTENGDKTCDVAITREAATNGELCYKLNGEKSEDCIFFQNIGQDKCPVPFPEGHAPVFCNNGSYSNADGDGFYYIDSAEQLYNFAKAVNAGDYARSAKITADIDYSAYGTDGNALIGGSDDATAYTGTFDAQNHKITVNWNLDRATCGRAEGMGGLFGRMANGASVKNLWLDGTLKGNGHRMSGLCQNIKGVNFQNVVVTVNIISTWKGEDSDLASGGIFGQATGTNRLNNVIFAGSFKCKDNGGNGKNEWFAGICGWVENGLTTLENCASIIESFEVDDVSAVGSDENGYNIKTSPMSRHDENLVEAYNCYSFIPEDWQYKTNYKNYFTENGDKTCDESITREAISSGELCYKLNGDQSEIVFYQEIGEDPYPTIIEKELGLVYLKDGVYTNSDADIIRTADDLYKFAAAVNAGDVTRNAKVVADIDYSAYGTNGNALIGGSDDATSYAGTFDAQNHKITVNWNLDRATCGRAEGMGGLFGRMANGASVKNLWLDGTLMGNGHRMSGLCQNIKGVSIQNVLVTVNIISTWKGEDGDLASGGIFGQATGTNRLTNVVFDGSFKCKDNGGNGKNEWFAGICGWVENGLTTLENCASIIESFEVDEVSAVGSDENGYNIKTSPMSRHDENLVEAYNCYSFIPEGWQYKTNYKNYFTENGDKTCDVALTREQIESGELCFLLNGNQSNPVFFQTIGTDKIPYITTDGHKQVYGKGSISCGGELKGGNSFSNEAPNEMEPHNFVDGQCTVCGALSSETTIIMNADGFYEIGDKYQMQMAYDMVNNGDLTANFKLVADIDMSGDEYKKSYFSTYAGTFDGQFHTLTVNIEAASSAIFGSLTGTVKNLIVKGKMVNLGEIAGVISSTPGNCTIENVVNYVEFHSQYSGSNGDVNMGGFIGDGGIATVNLINCVYCGHIIQDSFLLPDGTTDYYDFQGIGGLVGRGSQNTINIRSCVVAGEAPSYYGPSHPTSGTGNKVGGEYTNAYNGTFIGNNRGTVNSINVYSTYSYGTMDGGSLMDPEKATNGELCYTLNGGAWDEPAWRQNIDEDPIPMPLPNKGIVYKLSDGTYMDVHDIPSMQAFQPQMANDESAWLESCIASETELQGYDAFIEAASRAETVEDFKVAYKNMMQKKDEIGENIAAYASYKEMAEEAMAYMDANELMGDAADLLKSYLYDEVEAGNADFPNGSYVVIIEDTPLNTQQIRDEKDFLSNLYRNAIGTGYVTGTDISVLLTNANFANGVNGWSGNGGTGFITNGADNQMPIVETWRATIDRYQTLTGLKNGVYELSMNANVRPAGRDDSKFYTAYLYANDNMVPFMGLTDDLLPFGDAKDLENCYIVNAGTYPYDYTWNDEFFYPSSYTGCPYAFLGGRYENTILVNVTDGTLKVGFKNDGTGSDYDLLWNGNTKLTYLGELGEESDFLNEAVAKALEDQIARATALIEMEASAGEYKIYPNFSQELKDALNDLVSKAYEADGAQSTLDLIAKFSALYPQIQDCQKAYIHMLDLVDQYTIQYDNQHSSGVIDDDKFAELLEELSAVTDAFFNGSYTAEEAWNLQFGKGADLGDALIVSASQLSSNASDRDEGKNLGALIDGNADTFWHTDWHSECQDEYHYLQVEFPVAFSGDMRAEIVRRNTDNDHPTQMMVWTSNDGVNFTEFTTISFPFNGKGTTEYSEVLTFDTPVKYLRFAATDCASTGTEVYRTFWHSAEFQLYGKNTNSDGVEGVLSGVNKTNDIYNLMGQKLQKVHKGINIINGKKVLVK